jgi:hypothetical protein
VLALLLLLGAGGAGAYLYLNRDDGVAVASLTPTSSPTATVIVTPVPSATPTVEATPLPTPPPVAWQWVECEPGLACEDETVRRDQMAHFLARAFELPPVTDADSFTDIAGNEFRGDINAVAVADLTAGCTGTLYCPDGLVTKEQMATFIVRAFDVPPSDEDFFTDDEDSDHEAAINAVTAAGIAAGCDATSFCPEELITRGDAAGYLSRALNL